MKAGPHFKENKVKKIFLSYYPNSWESEAEGLQVRGQLELPSESLSQEIRASA
jgi:hypothetical protein